MASKKCWRKWKLYFLLFVYNVISPFCLAYFFVLQMNVLDILDSTMLLSSLTKSSNFLIIYFFMEQEVRAAISVIFWPSTRPKNAIPRWCTGRKWHIPMANNRKRSRGRIKAYNMGQGEGPTMPLQWCTGRKWPVNCMTVISAWWRLNIRFQRSSGRSCGRWIII